MSLTDTFSDFRPRDLLSPPTGQFDTRRQPVTLRRQLLASHLRLAALCALSLGLALLAVHSLKGPIQETDQRRVPMTKAAMTVQIGLHRASAALRGWVALKDEAFRSSRRLAWEQEILPAMAVIEMTTRRYAGAADIERFGNLQQDLLRLQNLQNWVEDVAAKPGNEPARMVLTQELLPLSADIDGLLAELIAGLGERNDPSIGELATPLNELRFSIIRSDRALGRFVVDGMDGEEAAYRAELVVLDQLGAQLAAESAEEAIALRESLQESLETYRQLAESVIASRRSPRSNVAWNTIQTRLKPLENQLSLQLEGIAVHEASMVTAVVSRISDWVSTVNAASFLLLALVSGLAVWLSASAARQLSTPIYKLARGVGRLEQGQFHEPLREDGVVEVRDLIASYNRMQRAIQSSHAQLRYLAHNDELTGLPNRKSFNDRLLRLSRASEREANCIGIIYIDLDHFKDVNDTHGHDVGDALLREFAARLQDSIRDGDLAARLGGDEFVVILGSLADANDAVAVVERIRAQTMAPMDCNAVSITPSCTIGIAIANRRDSDLERLHKQADTALYRAKRHRRGTWQFYDQPAAAASNV